MLRENKSLYIFIILTLFLFITSCESHNYNKSDGFNLVSLKNDNKYYSLNDFIGKPLILNFWASWCAPCREELPFLEKNWKKYEEKINFVGINTMDSKEEALKTLKKYEISYLNLYDLNGKTSNNYEVTALPVTLFIDKKGSIIKKNYGPFLGEKGKELFNSYIKDFLE